MQSAVEHARSWRIAFRRDANESFVLIYESAGRLIRRMNNGNSAQDYWHYHIIAESNLDVLDRREVIRWDTDQAATL